jgi:hypothetical protein
MTVAEAVIKFLEEAKASPDFDINTSIEWLEQKISDVVEEWAAEADYEFDDEQCRWVKIP